MNNLRNFKIYNENFPTLNLKFLVITTLQDKYYSTNNDIFFNKFIENIVLPNFLEFKVLMDLMYIICNLIVTIHRIGNFEFLGNHIINSSG